MPPSITSFHCHKMAWYSAVAPCITSSLDDGCGLMVKRIFLPITMVINKDRADDDRFLWTRASGRRTLCLASKTRDLFHKSQMTQFKNIVLKLIEWVIVTALESAKFTTITFGIYLKARCPTIQKFVDKSFYISCSKWLALNVNNLFIPM